jgi:hypothetical protein
MSSSLQWLQSQGLVERQGKFYLLSERGQEFLQHSRADTSTVSAVWAQLADRVRCIAGGP